MGRTPKHWDMLEYKQHRHGHLHPDDWAPKLHMTGFLFALVGEIARARRALDATLEHVVLRKTQMVVDETRIIWKIHHVHHPIWKTQWFLNNNGCSSHMVIDGLSRINMEYYSPMN